VGADVVVGAEESGGTLALRRQVYLWSLGLISPVIAALGWFNRDEPLAVPVYATLTVTLIATYVGLLRGRLRVPTAEHVVVGTVSAVVLVRLTVVALLDPIPLEQLRGLAVETIGPTTAAIILVVYLAYEHRRARAWALLLWGGFTGTLVLRVAIEPGALASPATVAFARQSFLLAVFAGLAYALASVKSQLADERARTSELDDLARTDTLTGARNRRGVQELLCGHLARLERYGGELSIALFDLDNFKDRNDHHGHAAGDAALIEVTSALRARLRATDALARWGGDELLIVAPEIGGSEATQSAERWRALVADLAIAAGDRTITTSIGVATYRPGDDMDALLGRADRAMYAAKRAGGDRVVTDGELEPDTIAVIHDVTDVTGAELPRQGDDGSLARA
jgi:diguanylate cyclase (GGDEF)-like protein